MFARRCVIIVIGALSLLAGSLARAQNGADPSEALGGHMRAEVDGRSLLLPLANSDFSVSIDGDLANVTLVQTFENPTDTPINATYLFPLNEDAAVYAMTMEVGDEMIEAQIRRREQARQEFEQAQREGRAAALLSQHRPNMFTQEVANLMPGARVRVTLRYAQSVPRVDGAYELVLPLVVGPRYNPAPRAQAQTVSGSEGAPAADESSGAWRIGPPPAYPSGVFGLSLPGEIAPERVSIAIDLEAGMPIGDVASATHALTMSGEGRRRRIALNEGRVIDNRDFVLRYTLAGGAVQTGVLTHADARGGFFSLVIEPPAAPREADIAAREMVFVLDTSGSMSGEPIEASKAFMLRTLAALRPGDYFRIIQFGSTPRELNAGPVPATAANISRAQAYVRGMSAGGGTEVAPALRQAFSVPQQPNTLRIVVFLSDGYIGNEAEVLHDMAARLGSARVYAFGVGTSVNRYLLSEMARRGRGFARYIDPTETSFEAAQELAQRLEAPVLTDIRIDWGGLEPSGVTPAIIPDLFAGDSLRLMGRFTGSRSATITVHGKVNGRPASLPVRVTLSDVQAPASASASAIPVMWARAQVGDLMRDYTSPVELRASGLNEAQLEERVTALGLEFALVTDWTSFVAVSRQAVNANPGSAQAADVPLSMPRGVGPEAYGEMAFGGASTPEPSFFLLLALLAGLMLYGMRLQQRAA
ncbi:MAG TPA: VIT and VWA domain-containing protein [Vitreimonas sp.]|uniref:VIT and vWA domain-containing protein n=1 Tax=Vitreimonas sp. TaxID=3069702 RepID=UPI002D70B86C|nr:VIT and VWA domain-containing protein [Vitreimonas sp.]HYD89761.1 VIT and VWA domain-containing protein [Vitreimonas sp.]